MHQGHDTPAANTSEQTDDYPKEMEQRMAHWTASETQHLSRAQLQVLSPRRPGCYTPLSESTPQLVVGLDIKQSATTSAAMTRRDFAICVCWEHLPVAAGRATPLEKSTRLAVPLGSNSTATCSVPRTGHLCQRTISTCTSLLSYAPNS